MNNSDNPLVSIITPGWNGVGFVHRLLDSIIEQTYKNIEFIYIDDGSTDGTKDIVLSYKEKFQKVGIIFKYIYQVNGGVSAALNQGLKIFTGDYLCWPEYDDYLEPTAIEERLNFLLANPDFAVVTCEAYIYNDYDLKNPIGFLSNKSENRFEINQFELLILRKSIFVAGCHMARSSYFLETHPDRQIYPSRKGPNWQMLLPMYYKYKRGFIDKPLFNYIIRRDSISHSDRTLEDYINANAEFENILNRTLRTIPMPKKELKKYMVMAGIYFGEQTFWSAVQFNDKAEIKRQYKHLKKKNAITNQIKNQYHESIEYWKTSEFWISTKVYKIAKKIKYIVIRN